MISFKNKNILITGASGGMGLECVKQFEQNNIKILMLKRFMRSNLILRFSISLKKKLTLMKFNTWIIKI